MEAHTRLVRDLVGADSARFGVKKVVHYHKIVAPTVGDILVSGSQSSTSTFDFDRGHSSGIGPDDTQERMAAGVGAYRHLKGSQAGVSVEELNIGASGCVHIAEDSTEPRHGGGYTGGVGNLEASP